MILSSSNFEYQIGGSLDSEAPSYVTRLSDSVFYEALKAGEFCYVLNPRQTGKSSLRVRTMQRLEAEGNICVFIDLTGLGSHDMTLEQWYAGIVYGLVSGCELTSKIQWRNWWREQRELLSPVQLLGLFIERILLVEIKENIIIFMDEIDRIIHQRFSLDDFFALVRFCIEQRNVNPEYKRLTFAMLGVTTPNELIQDPTKNPFNLGISIKLQGFKLHEVTPLLNGLKGKVNEPETMLKTILAWTGGQPFLTQKLCHLVVNEAQNHHFISVEQVVKSRIIENWEYQDEPEHLRTIRDRICYQYKQKRVQLLDLYKRVLKEGEIPADSSPECLDLRLSGLGVEKQGKITVSSPIYQAVFNHEWMEKILNQLRP